ncbi:hypothetical protein [Symbioplanes lichenis]|uniref:hypothetical protein n=1 Tax=Symbioplanes lichenis TaxID=1629072 RepID=UPI0027382480|nr:hypothetical protein [Actinoplanes lichenis]
MTELQVDPSRAARAGADLAASGGHLEALRAGAGAEVAALSNGRPWGKDDIGQAFERNYRPAEEQVLHAWDLLGRHVAGLGDEVVQAVHEALAADDRAATGVRHPYGRHR